MKLKTLYLSIILLSLTCSIASSQTPRTDILQQDVSCLFDSLSMIGVLGDDCSRIDVRFSEAEKVNDTTYTIKGITRTRLSIICPFSGEVCIDSISSQPIIKSECTDIDGFIYGHYQFKELEDNVQSGIFYGIFKQAYRITGEIVNKGINEIPELKMNLSEYLGEWKSSNGIIKVCLWSDEVIPGVPVNFCRFNDAGEWIVLPQYRKNGWDNLHNAYHNENLKPDEIQKARTIETQKWWIDKTH